YAVSSCTATDGGVEIVLEKRLTGGSYMAGATIRKTFTVPRGAATFSVTSEVRNTTAGEVEFSYRFHNMPGFLELRDDVSGTAAMGNHGTETTFSRTFKRHMYTMVGVEPDARLSKAFDMATRSTISEPNVSFRAPWCTLKVTAMLADAPLNAIVFWDSRAMPCPTFEPIFSRVSLPVGEAWQATMHWRVDE
ncbi:MAG: hypothetical protein HON70_32100, partial [Lentisphaerae bacterium]|nr:hypothetical protein [Lentisphaerota bacterium]